MFLMTQQNQKINKRTALLSKLSLKVLGTQKEFINSEVVSGKHIFHHCLRSCWHLLNNMMAPSITIKITVLKDQVLPDAVISRQS